VGVKRAEAGPPLSVAPNPTAVAVDTPGDGTAVEDGRALGGVAEIGSCGAGLVTDGEGARGTTDGTLGSVTEARVTGDCLSSVAAP